jgi:hypothetical protein
MKEEGGKTDAEKGRHGDTGMFSEARQTYGTQWETNVLTVHIPVSPLLRVSVSAFHPSSFILPLVYDIVNPLQDSLLTQIHALV